MTSSPNAEAPLLTHPSWCDSKGGFCTTGEHFPDFNKWPAVTPTGDPGYDGEPRIVPHPFWAEGEGLGKVVALSVVGSHRVKDVTLHLKPDEALELAARLLAAAEAVAG